MGIPLVFLGMIEANPDDYGQLSNDSNELYSGIDIFDIDSLKVSDVPKKLGLHPFYKKYIDAKGIPIISSQAVPDKALLQARKIVIHMLDDLKVPREYLKFSEFRIRIAVMSKKELTTDVPEHSDLNDAFPKTDWDARARGLGATIARPATSCAEENLLCYSDDRYSGEDILVHEFAHTIHEFAIIYFDPHFEKKLRQTFKKAISRGLWADTYAKTNIKEYWAEGVQDWYNVNKQSVPTDGIHNQINTRMELREYDPDLFDLISQYFDPEEESLSCHSPL